RSAQLKVSEESYAETHVVGGGGGYSGYDSMPTYQRQVRGTSNFTAVEYLQPTDFTTSDPDIPGLTFGVSLPWQWNFNPTPPTTTGNGSGRATPDLSTAADPAVRRHELRRAAAERSGVGDRLDARSPCRLVEPGDLPVRHIRQLAV